MMTCVYSGISLGLALPALSGWMEVAGAVLAVFIVLTLATSLLRFEYLTKVLPGGAAPDKGAPAAFPLQVAERLSQALRREEPFLVILVHVTAASGPQAATWAAGLLDKGPLRKQDRVFVYLPDTLGILAGAACEHAPVILRRVTACLEAAGARVRTGCASFPEHGRRTNDLLDHAARALEQPGSPAGDAGSDHDVMPETLSPEDARYLDSLTGAIRSDRVESEARKYLAAYRRDGLPVVFLYIALDAVEGYRSRFGEEGLRALVRETAQVLQRNIRTEDLIGRCDETSFLVLLSCPADAAITVAQRLILAIRRKESPIEGQVLKATVCVGVACSPLHEQRPGRLYAQAYQASQRAQARGQGLSLVYDPAWDAPRRKQAPVRERY